MIKPGIGFLNGTARPGGITGTLLLAESHLAIHTWPERNGVTLDVYVCNFTDDNTSKAEQLFEALMLAFRPKNQVVNRITRGDLAAGTVGEPSATRKTSPKQGELIFDWLNAHSGYGTTATNTLAQIQSPVSKGRGLRHAAVWQTVSARRPHDDFRRPTSFSITSA